MQLECAGVHLVLTSRSFRLAHQLLSSFRSGVAVHTGGPVWALAWCPEQEEMALSEEGRPQVRTVDQRHFYMKRSVFIERWRHVSISPITTWTVGKKAAD